MAVAVPQDRPPEPALAQPAVIDDPPDMVPPLSTNSHLGASLEHLRRRSTLRAEADPTPAPPPSQTPAPAPPPEPTVPAVPDAPAVKASRRDRKVARKYARREAREETQRAKKEKTADKAAAKATAKSEERPSRWGRRRQPASTPTAPSPPPLQPIDLRGVKRERRLRIAAAKQSVADQRREGKARVAAAEQRSRARDYLASKVPPGDWTRKERRQHLRTARQEAKEEAAAIKTEEGAKLITARDTLAAEKQSGRLSVRARTAHLADARVRSIRLGLAGSWVGLAAFAWVAWDASELGTDDYWIPLVAGSAGLLVLSLIPWKRFSGRPVTSVLVFLWLALLMTVMIATAPYHDSTLGMFIAGGWIILYAGVLLPPVGFALSSALVIAAFGTAVAIGPVAVTNVELALYVAGLGMTTLIVGITVHELRSQGVHTAERLAELDAQGAALRRRESELLQLYEVSRTIGAGEDMQQVLPELVARTAGYIEAKVGLVILHQPEEEKLVALSPLWVAGQALEAEIYRFEVDGDSTAAAVFGSGTAHVRNSLTEIDISRDRLLADLGVERVAAVPLQVEGQTIGVLLVADKAIDFTQDDIAALELLATPAGLVLSHLSRYQEAQETGRRMGELAQLKSDFVSVVSHELRTPLTSVIGALSTLSRPELAPDDPVALSLLDSASGQAKRLKTLIEDLLTVSKIDNEALPIRLEIGDLGQILTRLLSTVPAAWTEHIELALSPRLPKVAIDPDHFERAITNLLDNARKYAAESPIEITARAVDDEVWVSVIDHGEGIPYEYEETIFERFTQIERPDTRFKGGTGLGLNIVKDLTEAMQGRVWLEATPGSGATFTLAFPRAEHGAEPSLQVGPGMLLVDPGRDRVEAPVDMHDLSSRGEGPVAE